eukprot:2779218-Rhodomonas_salina.3
MSGKDGLKKKRKKRGGNATGIDEHSAKGGHPHHPPSPGTTVTTLMTRITDSQYNLHRKFLVTDCAVYYRTLCQYRASHIVVHAERCQYWTSLILVPPYAT